MGSCLRKDPVFDGSSFCGLISVIRSLEWRWAEGKVAPEAGERDRCASVFSAGGAGMWYEEKGEPYGAVMDW